MKTKNTKGLFVGSKLKRLIDVWPAVKEILGVSGMHAVGFVEKIFIEKKVSLYLDNEHTGLWSKRLFDEGTIAMVTDLGCSDFAHGFFNGSAIEPGGWADFRVTPRDFDMFLREARKVAQAAPDAAEKNLAPLQQSSTLPNPDKRPHHKAISYDVLKSDHEKLNLEARKGSLEYMATLHELIDTDQRFFARAICEATLGIVHDEFVNPFLNRDKDGNVLLDPKMPIKDYGDAARVFLDKLTNPKSPLPDGDYISLRDWIARGISKPDRILSREFDSHEPSRIAWIFFEKNESCFGFGMDLACEMIYQGIPLYELLPDGGYRLVDFRGDDYIYLSKKGEHHDPHSTGMFPYWVHKYHVKREHLDKHRIFFSQPGSLDKADVEILRGKFREVIGITGSSASSEKAIMATNFRRPPTFQQLGISWAEWRATPLISLWETAALSLKLNPRDFREKWAFDEQTQSETTFMRLRNDTELDLDVLDEVHAKFDGRLEMFERAAKAGELGNHFDSEGRLSNKSWTYRSYVMTADVFVYLDKCGFEVPAGWRVPALVGLETTSTAQKAAGGNLDADHVCCPAYLDSKHECFSPKLAAAVAAWRAVTENPTLLEGTTPYRALFTWLKANAADVGLLKPDGEFNKTGAEETARVANWKKGGASKTPDGESEPA